MLEYEKTLSPRAKTFSGRFGIDNSERNQAQLSALKFVDNILIRTEGKSELRYYDTFDGDGHRLVAIITFDVANLVTKLNQTEDDDLLRNLYLLGFSQIGDLGRGTSTQGNWDNSNVAKNIAFGRTITIP